MALLLCSSLSTLSPCPLPILPLLSWEVLLSPSLPLLPLNCSLHHSLCRPGHQHMPTAAPMGGVKTSWQLSFYRGSEQSLGLLCTGDEGGCVLEGRASCEGEKRKGKGLPSGWGIARRGPKPMENWKDPVRMRDAVLGGEHLHMCVQRRERLRKEEPTALRIILPLLYPSMVPDIHTEPQQRARLQEIWKGSLPW